MLYFDTLPTEVIVRLIDNETIYNFTQVYADLDGSLIKEYVRTNDKELYKILGIIVNDLNFTWLNITSYLFDDPNLLRNKDTLMSITKSRLYRYHQYLNDPYDVDHMGFILPVIFLYYKFNDVYNYTVVNKKDEINQIQGVILAIYTDMKWEGYVPTCYF